MKRRATLVLAGFLLAALPVHAQQFHTNAINTAQAVKLGSQLRMGMKEEQIAKVFDEQNGLTFGGDIGDSTGWSRFYLLSDGCFLDLEMKPSEFRTDGKWGRNGLLQSASIQSNQVKIIWIKLADPIPFGDWADWSRTIEAITNRPTGKAGSRR